MLVLLLLSALFSGSEVAFFSLSPNDLHSLEDGDDLAEKKVLELLQNPSKKIASKELLATILIANNFVNVAIVLLSSFIANTLISESISSAMRNVIQIGVVTFVLVLFGEVIPKVYASSHNVFIAKKVSSFLMFLKKIFKPLSKVLIHSTKFIDKRFKNHSEDGISTDELEHAIELTHTPGEDKKIYQGIINFGNLIAKQAMTARTDIFAFDVTADFEEILKGVKESKYSRIPVYNENLDTIVGILYIKDVLPFISTKNLEWQNLMRTPFFIPELKKLDDLMREFQERKNHMAIVVDEYGGTSGLITLEDVLEEIVGEITDEFDEDGLNYSKLDENTYLFEAKTSLPDVYRIIGLDNKDFDAVAGDSSTLGGLVVELAGKIPMKGEKINFEHYAFVVDAADKRKVKRIKLILHEKE